MFSQLSITRGENEIEKGDKDYHGCIFDFIIVMNDFIASFANYFIYAAKNRFAKVFRFAKVS